MTTGQISDIGPVPRRFREDETARRYREGWGPWERPTDPIEFECALWWTPRAPLANHELRF